MSDEQYDEYGNQQEEYGDGYGGEYGGGYGGEYGGGYGEGGDGDRGDGEEDGDRGDGGYGEGGYGEELGSGDEGGVEGGEFGVSFNDWGRVGIPGKTSIGKGALKDIAEELEKRSRGLDPKQHFKVIVDGISRKFMSDGVPIKYKIGKIDYDLNEETIKKINEGVELVENIEYKNPVAFILGYFASNGGKKIEKQNIEYIMEFVTDVKDKKGEVKKSADIKIGNVKPPDVIRYANLWIRINK